jgi:alpha-glucoside transport system substrate-binding protein
MNTVLGRFIAAFALVTMAACTADSNPASEEGDAPVVRVFGNYRGQQADDFRLVLERFTDTTGIRASYVGTAGFPTRLQERLRDGDAPDVAMFPQPAILTDLVHRGLAVPLGTEASAAVSEHFADELREIMMVDDTLYGVWFKASVKSLVWYRPDEFERLDYSIPATWDELLDLSAQMVSDGQTPWCLGMESFASTGWVGTDWIEDIVLRLYGPAIYDQWVDGEIEFTDARIEEAFSRFGAIALRSGWVEGGRRAVLTVPAMRAIDPLLDDPPGCLMTRQASFQVFDLPADVAIGPGGDVDVFVLPSFGADAAPLVAAGEIAAALTDSDEAQALLAFLADPAAGEPWAEASGYTAPHGDFDASTYASDFDRRVARLLADAQVVRFDGSDLMPPEVGTGTFWDGMIDYVSGARLEDVLENIDAGYRAGSGVSG